MHTYMFMMHLLIMLECGNGVEDDGMGGKNGEMNRIKSQKLEMEKHMEMIV